MPAIAHMPDTHAIDTELTKLLHAAVHGLAKTLGNQVNAVIVQQLKRHASTTAIEEKVAAAMPELIEQAFIVDLLQNEESARRSRALLMHLLTSAELQCFEGSALKQPVSALSVDIEAEDELTTEAAAKLLQVSRTRLVTLVASGQLGKVRRTAGGHRRISKAAVLRYKSASKERQAKGLGAMVEASERLGLYDQELDGVRDRAKR